MLVLTSPFPITINSTLFRSSGRSQPKNPIFHRPLRFCCPGVLGTRVSRTPWSRKKLVRCFSSDIPAQGKEEEEAREVVVSLLQEFGASEEESIEIGSNSPNYLAGLVANVRELDDHSLWNSWSAGEDATNLSFKRKVYLMAKSKGDGGILPFLESCIGLKYSSAMLVARYLSSEALLPHLIAKVRLKQILFSSITLNELIGRNARRTMVHLSISIDEDIQRTLSFFEKMEAKQGGLNSLGYEDASFPYLIESFPKLLSLSVEDQMKPLVDFLVLIGVPKESARLILLSFPPIFFYDIEREIKPRMCALEKAGVKEANIGRMLLKYPWLLSTCIQENYQKIHSLFNGKKVQECGADIKK